MSGDSLQQLLREADGRVAASTPARTAGELVEAVWRRHRNRQARRARVGAAATLIACVALSAWFVHQPRQNQRSAKLPEANSEPIAINPTPTIDPEQARAAYLQSVAEADRAEAALARMRPRASRASGRAVPAEVRLEIQREQATQFLLHQGDELSREPGLHARAAVAYRQAADLFPETRGAAAAKQRLDALN